jgi:CheY-like chemotaxis protein
MAESILVVEAVRPVARAVAAVLERRGYVVTVAASSAEVSQMPHCFDCGVFSDHLPDGSGISLAGWLLAENRVASAVFFGDTLDRDVRLRANNLGTFVHKSEGIHQLAKTIAETLEGLGQHARAAGDPDDASAQRPDFKSGARRKR